MRSVRLRGPSGAHVFRALLVSLAGLSLLVTAACSSSSSSSSSSGGTTNAGSSGSANAQSHLSLSDIKILLGTLPDPVAPWIAYKAGFFKQQGLNVSFVIEPSSSANADLSVFLSGAGQFTTLSTAAMLPSVQHGSGIKAITQETIGDTISLAIPASLAAKYHVPLVATNSEQATAQLEGLKGSHITVAVSNVPSTSYTYIVAACSVHGLSCGLNAPGDDINLTTAGSSPTELAGYGAGRYQGIVLGGLLNLYGAAMAHAVDINLGAISPNSTAASLSMFTTGTMIQQHPDTVQAVVNALVEAWHYTKTDPAGAENYLAQFEAQYNPSDSKVAKDLYDDFSTWEVTPRLLMSSYETLLKLEVLSRQPTPVAYGTFNDPTFVDKALTELKIAAPTTVAPPAKLVVGSAP